MAVTREEVLAEIQRRQSSHQPGQITGVTREQVLEEIQRRQQPQELRPGGIGDAIVEPISTIASGLVAEPLAGLAGLATTAFGDSEAGAETIGKVREALTFKPRTQAGQAGLETVGDLIQKGVDLANVPLSGLGGIIELVSGQGLDQAAETIKNIQSQGVGKTLGDRVFEETGSPVAATISATAPTAALSAFPIKKKPATGSPVISAGRAGDIERALQAGVRQDVPVLTSDIFPPRGILAGLHRQLGERVPLLGTGGKRAEQQSRRVKALEDLNDSIPNVETADIITGLKESANKVRRAAGARINDIDALMDATGQAVPTTNTVAAIDNAIAELTKPTKIESPEVVKSLQKIKEKVLVDQSFSTMRTLRRDARSELAIDGSGLSQLRSSDQTLLDGILRGAVLDMDNFVRANGDARNFDRYKKADEIYAQEAKKLTESKLKTVLDKGEFKPELVNTLLRSSEEFQVKLLFKNLGPTGRQNARHSLMKGALDKSITKGEFSPEKFVTELGKLEDNFNVFYRGDARAELQGMKRLLETTKRAGESGVVTPTGQATQLSAGLTTAAGAASGNIPAIIATSLAGGVGLTNRIYESSGVRNMLIRLGKAPKRGTLEADLLKTLPLLIQQANQDRALEESGERVQ